MRQLIADEDFTSVQKAQAGLTRLIKAAERKGRIVRVLRNNQSLGVILPNKVWQKFLHRFEELSLNAEKI